MCCVNCAVWNYCKLHRADIIHNKIWMDRITIWAVCKCLTDYTFENLGLIIVQGIADNGRLNRNIDLFTLIKTKDKIFVNGESRQSLSDMIHFYTPSVL